MKGCLKVPTPTPSPGLDGQPHCTHRKCVAFGLTITEEVHTADEWDRTPTEPARKLTYQDLLELKEIQRSLPRANQPCDLISGRPARHYLSAVPIGLLPLLAESDDSAQSSLNASPVTSPRSSSPVPSHCDSAPVSPWAINFHRQKPPPPHVPASAYKAPAHLSHLLPSRAPADRPKPRFAFLPLLDTPPSSGNNSPYPSNSPSRTPSPPPLDGAFADLLLDTDHSMDPPTPSLTNASLDSSPHSRASSCSPEPPFFQLPPPNGGKRTSLMGSHDSYFPPPDEFLPRHPMHHGSSGLRLHATNGPTLLPPSPLALEVPIVAPTPKPAKKRNFILVNDIEIDLDDDEEEEEVVEAKEDPKPVEASSDVPSATTAPTVADTALSETNAVPTTIPSSHPTTKLESAWSDPRPMAIASSEPPTTPTPTASPPRTPKSATSSRTASMSPPPSPSSRMHGQYHQYHYHQQQQQQYLQQQQYQQTQQRPQSPPAHNLHMPVMFKRVQPPRVAGGSH